MTTLEIDIVELERFKETLPQGVRGESFHWGSYRYRIPHALFLVFREHLEPRTIKVKAWCETLGMAVPLDQTGKRVFLLNGVTDAEAMASTINPNIPLIIADHVYGPPNNRQVFPLLIDGNKRLRKAYLEDRHELKAYCLPHELAKLIKA